MITERMKLGFSGKVRGMCDFWTVKEADPKTFSRKSDLSNPFAALLVPAHSKKSAFVVLVRAFSIAHIFRASGFPKVGHGVVGSDTISMVDLAGREGAMNVQPSQPMSKVSPIVNQNPDVPVFPDVSGYASGVSAASGIGAGKQPSLRAIVQNFAQSFGGNVCRIFGSHDAPPVRWDQGPGRVDSACLASPY